ncbi:GrpB family protein [Anaerosalibacter massiliensis]|uniref:GrpB family protein n=1 Tax=Anaerosalibacter massiliensis TaxID=1347392 RepID=A0A9X2S661_9FIRM|nr:GrpB family protein [Anaerosalibacter massiliensis]MCR2045315.1 GrpB family protein [Anaerosalibacter massiliensis]
MIGVPRNKVILSEYDKGWEKVFEEEKRKILNICGDNIMTIEHIGSTSIPGLIAKPIIDIALTFDNKEKRDKIIESIVSLSYEFIQETDVIDRLFFVKRINRDSYYHIHGYPQDSVNYTNQILFRDYLRNHKEIAEEYAQLKKDLYRRYKDNRSEYTAGKSNFIKNLLKIITK